MKPSYKTSRLLIPLFIFFILLVFLCCGLYRDPHVIPSPLLGKSLPVFEMPSLANSRQKITTKNFIGQVTLLNVFATWCMSCRTEHPILMDIAHSGDVLIYGLDYKDDRALAATWLTEYGSPYADVID